MTKNFLFLFIFLNDGNNMDNDEGTVFPPTLNRAAGTARAPVAKAAVVAARDGEKQWVVASSGALNFRFFFGDASPSSNTTGTGDASQDGAMAADSLVIHQGKECDDKEEDE